MPTTGKDLLAMRRAAANQVPYQRSDCPICGWILEKHHKTGQLHCPFDGWTDSISSGRHAARG